MKNVVENCVDNGIGKIRLKNSVDKFGRKDVLNNCMKQKKRQFRGKIGRPIWWKNLMSFFLEQSGTYILCKCGKIIGLTK